MPEMFLQGHTYSAQLGMILKVPAAQMDLTHLGSVLHEFFLKFFWCMSSFNYIPCPCSLWFDLSTLVMTTKRMCMLSQLCVILLFIYLFRHKSRDSLQREGKNNPNMGSTTKRVLSNFYYKHIQSPISLVHISFWNQICSRLLYWRFGRWLCTSLYNTNLPRGAQLNRVCKCANLCGMISVNIP
jgi:hypothetical protein